MVFPNPKNTLLPGMYVRAIVQEGVAEDVILAPQQGISRDPKGNPIALIVNTEGKVEQRAVEVYRAIGDKWVVSSGLASGDKLIVEGIQRVRPGVPVKTIPFEDTQKGNPEPAKTTANPPGKTGQPATKTQ